MVFFQGQEQTEGKGDNIACTSLVEALLNKCQEEIEENTFSRRNAELWFSQRVCCNEFLMECVFSYMCIYVLKNKDMNTFANLLDICSL